MTQSEINHLSRQLPFGDGSDKVFGMENFGNTCYCNSILQCLFYTEKFRIQLISHHKTDHDRKTNLYGIKTHGFTNKYEMLVQKRMKEQQKSVVEDKSKTSRKSSIFGLKFNANSGGNTNPQTNSFSGASAANENSIPNKKSFVFELKSCEFLTNEQKTLINKSPNEDFKNIQIMITRPSQNNEVLSNKNDYSQSSSMLLSSDGNGNGAANGAAGAATGAAAGTAATSGSTSGTNGSISSATATSTAPSPASDGNGPNSLDKTDDGMISSQSSYIIIGIPYPETFLQNPINPFNPSPTSDHRKRSALINGPIINLDHSLQLPSEQREDSALLYALKDLFECMVENKSNIGVVSPNYFISKLKEKNYLFRQNNMHHDAHEFCNYLINEIIECLNKENGIDDNWCNQLFQGSITNETKCLSCETITSKEETFLDLSIDIPHNNHPNSLTHSLNNFSKLEILTHQNKFYCNSCSSLQEAIKTIKIKHLPEILVINFKRFKYDDSLDKMIKLFDSISYPLKLRLFNTTNTTNDQDDSNIINNFQLYELYALVVHIGGGPMHGHYISLCKLKPKIWILFDDETVEIVDESFVMKFFGDGPGLASAYILFYQKCDTLTDEEEEKIDFGFNVNDLFNGDDYEMSFSQPEHTNLVLVNGTVPVHGSASTHPDDNDNNTLNSSNKKTSVSSRHLDETSIDQNSYSPSFDPTTNSSSTGGSTKIPSITVGSNANSTSSANILPMKKPSIFKKNFKLDNTGNTTVNNPFSPSATGGTNSSTSQMPGAGTTGAVPSQQPRHVSTSSGHNPLQPNSQTPVVEEKKSWVGGLKRKELKADNRPDRKQSTASSKLIPSILELSVDSGKKKESKDTKEADKKPEKEKKKSFFGFKRK